MTLNIAHCTRAAGWIATDTLFSTVRDDGRREPTYLACKITVHPHLALIASAATVHSQMAGACLDVLGHLPGEDICHAASWAPHAFRAICAAFPDVRLPDINVCGWSRREGRAMGFAFQSADGLEPTDLTDSLSMHPPPDPESAAHSEIMRMIKSALGGCDVEQFHQVAAFDAAARFPDKIGGHLITARVDAAGVTIAPAIELPGVGGLRAAVTMRMGA